MIGCTVPVFNIILKRLAPCLFWANRRDLSLSGDSVSFLVKWSTLTAPGFGVLQHADVYCLSVLLRLAARGLHS